MKSQTLFGKLEYIPHSTLAALHIYKISTQLWQVERRRAASQYIRDLTSSQAWNVEFTVQLAPGRVGTFQVEVPRNPNHN